MAYNTSFSSLVRDDLAKTEGNRELVKASLPEKLMKKKARPEHLHVNPEDEFAFPEIGPNDAIIENYCRIARWKDATVMEVYPEQIQVCKMRAGGYMILNGHHRWAGAIRACLCPPVPA